MAAFIPLLAAGAGMAYDKWGKSNKMKKVSNYTKEQQGLLNQLMQMLGSGGQLGQGYNNALNYQQQLMDPSSEAVNQFAQPYMDQFNQQTVPQLADRFAGGFGAGANSGALSSSGFGQSLSAAGGQLQNQLAALKAGLGQQAAGQLMNQYSNMQGTALGAQPFSYQQQGPSAFGGALSGWAKGGFQGAGNMGNSFLDMYVNNMPGGV